MTTGDPYITIYETYNPIQAQILGDLLRENGIPARVLGTRSGAAIGVGQVILAQRIAVPRSQAHHAADFIEDFISADGEALLREAGVVADDDDDGDADGERHDDPDGDPSAANGDADDAERARAGDVPTARVVRIGRRDE